MSRLGMGQRRYGQAGMCCCSDFDCNIYFVHVCGDRQTPQMWSAKFHHAKINFAPDIHPVHICGDRRTLQTCSVKFNDAKLNSLSNIPLVCFRGH